MAKVLCLCLAVALCCLLAPARAMNAPQPVSNPPMWLLHRSPRPPSAPWTRRALAAQHLPPACNVSVPCAPPLARDELRLSS